MPWFFQLIIAVFMVISYIAIFKELRTNPNFLDRRLFYSLGVGMFTTLLIIFWILQYGIHHTIIYWRIVELFK